MKKLMDAKTDNKKMSTKLMSTKLNSVDSQSNRQINSQINRQNKTMGRRGFLQAAALGMGGVVLGNTHQARAIVPSIPMVVSPDKIAAIEPVSDPVTDLISDNVSSVCKTPTITTRLFASSNTGTNSSRNDLSLKRLTCAGFDIKNPKVTHRQYLRFAGTDAQRVGDLQNIATAAMPAPELLLGVRGGYGAMRLLEHIDWPSLGQIMQDKGTIMAGFSDVTAVQCALLAQGGMSSLAAPMSYSEFGKNNPDPISSEGFFEVLTNPNLTLELPMQNEFGFKSQISIHNQYINGVLWGGNLSIVSALAGSDYLPKPEGGIVFLEDVGEQPYRIERMLYSLYLSGAFKYQQAIVLGAFSRTGTDTYDERYNLSAVLDQLQRITGLPIYTGLPFGHVAGKHSFPLGAQCQLKEHQTGVSLTFSGYPVIARERISLPALLT